MKKYLEDLFTNIWYSKFEDISWFGRCLYFSLLPLSCLTALIAQRRIKQRIKRSKINPATQDFRSKLPLVVVGNITVGGTGKTPLLNYLAVELSDRGYRVGIVARGYGASKRIEALEVNSTSLVDDVGDEPLMLWRMLNTHEARPVPIAVHQQRNKAVALLEERYELDLILSDDGLQHYAMPRDIEVIVVDAERGFGNQKLLPAGPLREPLSRLNSVDYILLNSSKSDFKIPITTKDIADKTLSFSIVSGDCRPLNTSAWHLFDQTLARHNQPQGTLSQGALSQDALSQSASAKSTNAKSTNAKSTVSLRDLLNFVGNDPGRKVEELVFLAGIGNPQRFFKSVRAQLKNVGIVNYLITETSFPDHHQFRLEDFLSLNLSEHVIIVMTEKDAVKCESFADKISIPLYSIGSNVAAEESLSDLLLSLEVLAGENT